MVRPSEIFLDFNAALKHLQEENKASATAVSVLSGANKQEVAAFAQTWVRLPPERRRRVSQMLVDLAEENIELDFNPLFRYLLVDEDAQVRALGIEGLWEDEDTALVKPLIGFLRSDPNARVRAAAADSLGRFLLLAEYGRLPQSPHADLIHAALLATVRSGAEDLIARCRAVEALGYSSRDAVRDVIADAYADGEAEMRASAVVAMGHSADGYWRKAVGAELDSLDPRMRFEAVRAAAELEFRGAVPRLIEMLDDTDREVQMATITALGQIGGSAAKAALEEAVESEDEVLRDLADEALQELRFSSDPNSLLFDLAPEEELYEGEEEIDE
ncbi:MAG: HEAT repeat domain-containing protein [Chloroflexota bacterium]|nr:HEAT repeat domain-containing protein [Chloroflexota bacterium]